MVAHQIRFKAARRATNQTKIVRTQEENLPTKSVVAQDSLKQYRTDDNIA